MNDYHLLIDRAIQACIEQNASVFSSLFTPDGEIILNKNLRFSQPQIREVTQKYFTSLEYIEIEIKYILIDGNKGFVEWNWVDFSLVTHQENNHDNVIVLDFKDGLIYRWREYKG